MQDSTAIEIRMHGDVPSADELHVRLGWQGLFGDPFIPNQLDMVERENRIYSALIPVETERTIGCLKISDRFDQAYALGIVELTVGDTLILDCSFSGPRMTVSSSSSDGFNCYPMSMDRNPTAYVNEVISEPFFFEPGAKPMHGVTDPEKVSAAGENAWREVLRQNDEVYATYLDDPILEDLFQEREQHILQNSISTLIYATQYLPYDRIRRYWAPKGNREIPPLEYYDFLNLIDFSILTDIYAFYSPFIICRNIIEYLPVGIEPIGDTPVHEWKRQTAQKLGLVLNNVPDILLNMLSGASYQMQLDDEIRPFSATQVRNISEGYDDDLGKILLSHNDKLKAQLSRMGAVQDLTDRTEFDLRKYIDEKYPGKPVVVDFWNTWCGPCLQAHRDTETVRQMPEAEGVVFLYISDTSSPDKDFRRIAPGIDGEHLRLDQPVAYSVLEEEGLNGFPSYFFYDREHRLVHKQTTFPGTDAYRDIIGKLR